MPTFLTSCWGAEGKAGSVADFFSEGDVILFQGDSITDVGRNKHRWFLNIMTIRAMSTIAGIPIQRM